VGGGAASPFSDQIAAIIGRPPWPTGPRAQERMGASPRSPPPPASDTQAPVDTFRKPTYWRGRFWRAFQAAGRSTPRPGRRSPQAVAAFISISAAILHSIVVAIVLVLVLVLVLDCRDGAEFPPEPEGEDEDGETNSRMRRHLHAKDFALNRSSFHLCGLLQTLTPSSPSSRPR